jgi:GTP-binding protein
LLSKADKLSNSEKVLTLRKVKQALDTLDNVSVQLFSSLSRLGADDATILLEDWLSQAQQGNPPSAASPGESDM